MLLLDESGDDHEELLADANSSRCVKDLACSNSFWKKVKSLFASVSSEDTTNLKKQKSSVNICLRCLVMNSTFWVFQCTKMFLLLMVKDKKATRMKNQVLPMLHLEELTWEGG